MSAGGGGAAATKLLPRHHDEFRSKEYWDSFFQQRTDAFEWYGEYEDLRKLVHRTLRRTERILVIGCGNSNFSAELYDDGFEEIENVDFSDPVIAEMHRSHSGVRPKMTWTVMDVTDMSGYEDGSFDAVVDKGTLDALMSEDTAEVRESGEAMLREVKRVLKPTGRYMCVTLWQDFIGSAFLSSFAPAAVLPAAGAAAAVANSGGDGGGLSSWKLDLHSAAATSKPSPYLPVCVVAAKSSATHEREPIAEAGGEGGDEVLRVTAWCDRAGRPLGIGGEPSVLVGETEVLLHVRQAQEMHRRRFDLREIKPGRFQQARQPTTYAETEEDLWGEGEHDSPRFTLLVVDVSSDGRASTVPCAVVLIPRGRDRDFAFSSREGLHQVAASANAGRLIAVRLNRGHDFSHGVEGVKAEISPSISDFAPEASATATGGPGIPIMAVADGLGAEGRVVAEGRLECSGNYVVEEEEEEDEDEDEDESRPAGVYRRLIFLKNEGVVQTEVRMLGEGEDDAAGPPPASSRKSSKSGGGKKGKRKGKGAKGGKKTPPPAAVAAGDGAGEGVVEGGGRVDSSHLCFEYHSRCMIAGAALADFRITTCTSGGGGGGSGGQQKDNRAGARAPTALVIGLGGGALPMALRRMYPTVKVATVELDPEMAGVAKDHFGLRESPDGLKVIVEDGIAFVNAAVASVTGEDGLSANAARLDSTSSQCTQPISTPELSGAPAGSAPAAPYPPKPAAASLATETVLPPRPPDAYDSSHQTGWGEAFGPPYSAIFLDVDSKDTSVGMSCPPAAFLEPAFLTNLKTLLHGGGGGGDGGGGGQGGAGGPGVLAINVAARSKELFGGAVDAVCAAFAGGEVHKLRAGADDVNSVVLALPRPRGRARSGPLLAVAEQALTPATVSRKALASILEMCDRAEMVQAAQPPKTKSKTTAGGKGGKSKRSGR
ncbi:unnamed protein product [Ectocarpus sp. 13 AM-2016]